MATSTNNNEIALFAMLHPKSRKELIPLIKTTQPYITSAESRCSTFSYFVPSTREGAPNPYAKKSPNVVAGIEIYGEKAALSHQLEHPSYKRFRDALEKVNEKQDELIALYPNTTGGFVSRPGDSGSNTGSGTIVMIARMRAREGKRDDVIAAFAPFADWVKENEPDVLTYTFMTRKKAPNEIFVFERYRNVAAMAKHARSSEMKKLGGSLKTLLTGNELSEWTELSELSFVGKELESQGTTSKL